MKEQIDLLDEEEEKADKEEYKKIEKTNFLKRLGPYSRPIINVILGLLLSIVNGIVFPLSGLMITKALFAMMIPNDKDRMRDETWDWCLYMFFVAIAYFFGTFIVRFSFGVVGENITLNIRNVMYKSILKKAISWFDLKENSSGILTSILASDASTI